MLKQKILKAITTNCISKQSPFPMPPEMPFFAAASAVTLPKGCSAFDNRLGYRIATGTGWTQSDANFLASMEAIERFSSQYSNEAPKNIETFASSHHHREFPSNKVLLGAPGDEFLVTNVGCAAGPTLDFASTKAILEILEHHHLKQFISGKLEMFRIVNHRSDQIKRLLDWLAAQLRELDIRVSSHHGKYWFAVCSCADLNGGRKTESHGTGLTLNEAVNSAAKEALLFWRNMIEIEKRGSSLNEMTQREQTALKKYRGATDFDRWPAEHRNFMETTKRSNSPSIADLLNIANIELDANIYLLNLTSAKLNVPVVRCQVEP